MQEDLMEQKFVGSAEFNLAEAVYARSNPKHHGWLKKKLENVRRSSGCAGILNVTFHDVLIQGSRATPRLASSLCMLRNP